MPGRRISATTLLAALFLIMLVSTTLAGWSQEDSKGKSQDSEPGIQDNSFLIEEAYNQEDGVVQHISMFTRLWQSNQWSYTFTQEYPVQGQKNQLSYTLPIVHDGTFPGSGVGLGDAAINYRYQLVGSGETAVAFSPRATLLLPTGSVRDGRGAGGFGFQTNLPLSVELGKHFVTHWNVGGTIVPSAQDAAGDHASIKGYNLGQSIIWLAHPRFNVMLETLWTGSEGVVAKDKTQFSHDLLISPGIRWAYNFSNGLQIVPGVAVPLGAGPSAGEKGLILYLSFEHPWAAFKKHSAGN